MIESNYQSMSSSAPLNGDKKASAEPTATLSSSPLQRQRDEDDNRLLDQLDLYGKTIGLLYVVIIVCGIATEVGIRGQLIDFDSATQTADSISESPGLFRIGFVLELIMCCADVAVAVLLVALFYTAGAASKVLVVISSAFRLMQTSILATNLLHMLAASLLLDSTFPGPPSFYTNDEESQEEATGTQLAFFFLRIQKYGYLLALVFFGISLSLLGIVIVQHGVIPTLLGWFTFAAGIGYVVDSFLFFGMPGYDGEATNYLMLPVFIAEFGLTGWLLASRPTVARKE